MRREAVSPRASSPDRRPPGCIVLPAPRAEAAGRLAASHTRYATYELQRLSKSPRRGIASVSSEVELPSRVVARRRAATNPLSSHTPVFTLTRCFSLRQLVRCLSLNAESSVLLGRRRAVKEHRYICRRLCRLRSRVVSVATRERCPPAPMLTISRQLFPAKSSLETIHYPSLLPRTFSTRRDSLE